MWNRVFSFVIGTLLTAVIAGFAHYYLVFQKNKKGFEIQSQSMDLFETLDLRFTDLKYKFVKRPDSSAEVFMVAVDDDSLREVGRWPWGRDVMGDLTQKLMGYGIKAMGMDVIFAEPERGAPENDLHMGKVVGDNANRIVLGTFSDDEIKIRPYQDYCINEAFLAGGGDHLVKINPTFVVDDAGDDYQNLKWNTYFAPLFKHVREEAQREYLTEIQKNSADELNPYQKNYLRAKQIRETFEYCQSWLTDHDDILLSNRETMHELVRDLFSQEDFKKRAKYAALTVDEQIFDFKNSVLDLPVPQYGEWQSNIPQIQEPSTFTGSFLTFLDLDGYVRRYPMFFLLGNKIGVSFIF